MTTTAEPTVQTQSLADALSSARCSLIEYAKAPLEETSDAIDKSGEILAEALNLLEPYGTPA
jgi:hypothetical protein